MADRLNNFDERIVAAHNRERAALGVPALEWDPKLAAGASEWADHLATSGRFEHSPNLPNRPREGENIWGGTRGAFPPEAMVHLWVTEKVHFVPGVFPRNSRSGRVQDVSHYTQLIWKETTHVGCGVGQGDGEDILVCRYRQPGNVIGKRPL
ncbi:CAP family protein [Erythrobacter sp.]|uniref:CAP family protein n=1 Tax=Erythrobacter sp. TaxID=1042 RepID=UPI0025EA5F8B|nr:CAP family protein [Erythrobacter sp.]